MPISIDIRMKVYGLRSASLTIHMVLPKSAIARPTAGWRNLTIDGP